MLPLLVLAPLVGLIILNLPIKAFNRTLFAVVGLVLALGQIALVWANPPGFLELSSPGGLVLGLVEDNLARIMLVAIGMALAAAIVVGHETIKEESRQRSFINLILVSMMGMNGTVLLTDLFSLYVFIEITGVASFIMIALHRGKDAIEGAFKYLILSAVAGALMLLGVAFFLLTAGATDFSSVSGALAEGAPHPGIARVAMGVFICGLFVKGGMVPFHGWLPAAYSTAPSGVSVMLAGIATKVSGVYALIRVVRFVFAQDPAVSQILLILGILSIVVGALAALGQTDLKRMLAYSSISQVGYIILAVGCGTEVAMAGAVFHLFNHAVFKSLLFSNSAAVEQQLGTTDMDQMGGLGTKMPITSLTATIALLSTAGIPPLSGFWSKLIIVAALWHAGLHGYAVIAVLSSLLTLAYFLGMERRAFFGKVTPAVANVREANLVLLAPAVLLALVTIGLGLCFPYLAESFMVLGRDRLW